MTHSFCTLFDSNYLPRGLALYRSLQRHCPAFRLWVFCMDIEAERILRQLDLPDLTIVPLVELERHDSELLAHEGRPDAGRVLLDGDAGGLSSTCSRPSPS